MLWSSLIYISLCYYPVVTPSQAKLTLDAMQWPLDIHRIGSSKTNGFCDTRKNKGKLGHARLLKVMLD